jgi:alkylated DNA repair dioxygenase AlkB
MPAAVVEEPVIERVDLGQGAWVDVVRGFVTGADQVYGALTGEGAVAWQQSRLFRYERWVEENRLGAMVRLDGPQPHPVLLDAHRWLTHHYRVRFDGYTLAWYRDGGDGQAFHRDRDMRYLDETVIGILTLGATRPWLVRPRSHRNRHDLPLKGATHDLAPASGDLLVMGGRCQAEFEHSVPPVRAAVAGRVSVQWRWTSRRGQPVVGASYRAPRRYSR